MSIVYNLMQMERNIKEIKDILEKTPEITEIFELLKACESIDNVFKRACKEHDDYYEEEGFSSYNEGGVGIEFYIDDTIWGEASKSFRKLKKLLEEQNDI